MKRVISITLGSVVFSIEQDAYDALAAYLEQIKKSIAETDELEVVDDIERAIAEKFIARKRSEKMAVTLSDVDHVKSEMGSPAEFGEGGTGDDASESVHSDTGSDEPEQKKRLYRDADDEIIAGVASGLAKYFDIDPVIVRLVFVVLFFLNGIGLFVYLVLWLVVPVAKTTAEKYAMRGERVTLKEISERVKKNVQRIETSNHETTLSVWSRFRHVLEVFFRGLGVCVQAVVVVARYVFGVLLVFCGAVGIAAMVSGYSVILLSEKVFFPEEVQIALEVLQGSVLGILALISSFVTMTIPLVALILLGACLLAKRNYFTVQKVVTLITVWIVAAVLAGTSSVLQVEQVMQKIGPIDSQFTESRFQVEWGGGRLYGDEDGLRIYSPHEAPAERITVTGTYECLDVLVGAAPPSGSCIQGLRTAEDELYAIDLLLMSQIPPVLEVGDIITVSGPFMPAERMNASWWHESGVEGALSATSLQKEG